MCPVAQWRIWLKNMNHLVEENKSVGWRTSITPLENMHHLVENSKIYNSSSWNTWRSPCVFLKLLRCLRGSKCVLHMCLVSLSFILEMPQHTSKVWVERVGDELKDFRFSCSTCRFANICWCSRVSGEVKHWCSIAKSIRNHIVPIILAVSKHHTSRTCEPLWEWTASNIFGPATYSHIAT